MFWQVCVPITHPDGTPGTLELVVGARRTWEPSKLRAQGGWSEFAITESWLLAFRFTP
jgi:hypothetical protein